MRKIHLITLTAVVLIGANVAAACTQTYSEVPLSTPTAVPTSLFATAASTQSAMQVVAAQSTQTAVAKSIQTSGVSTKTTTVASAATVAVNTATTSMAAATVVVTSAPATATATIAPIATTVMVRPAIWTVKPGEFAYCLARRFDVNPNDLGVGSNLSVGDVVTIPQSGSFPGERALAAHPTSYTVQTGGTGIYAVACLFGDVLPQDIATANGLSLDATLSAGQVLQIP